MYAIFAQTCCYVYSHYSNVLVNKFPRGQIICKQSVARLCNKRGSCDLRVRCDVTTVDSDHVMCFL
jgi:hypothetical protein